MTEYNEAYDKFEVHVKDINIEDHTYEMNTIGCDYLDSETWDKICTIKRATETINEFLASTPVKKKLPSDIIDLNMFSLDDDNDDKSIIATRYELKQLNQKLISDRKISPSTVKNIMDGYFYKLDECDNIGLMEEAMEEIKKFVGMSATS